MGFKVAWTTIKGKSEEDILKAYGLEVAGDRTQDWLDDDVFGIQLTNGWYVVESNNSYRSESPIYLEDVPFQQLSSGSFVVGFECNETSMVSMAEAWNDGEFSWSMEHIGCEDVMHLETSGTLPEHYNDIYEKMMKEQQLHDDVDYIFDIPLQVAAFYAKYRHDTVSDAIDYYVPLRLT